MVAAAVPVCSGWVEEEDDEEAEVGDVEITLRFISFAVVVDSCCVCVSWVPLDIKRAMSLHASPWL